MIEQAIVYPILESRLDAPGLVKACDWMHQPNPAKIGDLKNLQRVPHAISALNEIQKEPYLTGNILNLGYIIIAFPDVMKSVLAYTGGMPHVYHNNIQNFSCAIVSGYISEWINCCEFACQSRIDTTVRFIFNKVYYDLESKIPRDMLKGTRRDNQDGTFLLEYEG